MFTSSVPLQSHLINVDSKSVPFSSSSRQTHFIPTSMTASCWSHEQQQNECAGKMASSIRKHRSLEGVHRLLLDNPSCSSAPSMFPEPPQAQFREATPAHYQYQLSPDHYSMLPNNIHTNSSSLLQPIFHNTLASVGYMTTSTTINDSHQFFKPAPPPQHQSLWSSSIGTISQGMSSREKELLAPQLSTGVDNLTSVAWTSSIGDSLQAPLYQPVSAHAILQQVDLDPRALRRELASLCDRFNYLASTVRNFWAPELRRERHRWREQCRRASEMEQRLSLMTSEAQMLRTDLQSLNNEQQVNAGQPRSRDFTETVYTMHEWGTLKAKLERSELSLADRTRQLSEVELRAQGAEAQKAELERCNEYLTRTVAANEAQIKLLQEDLEMLRAKLETKNQQLEARDKEHKRVEAELEMSKAQVREQEYRAQESERRVTQLTHQIDQLERDMRDSDAQLERLRKRMQEPTAARAEAELQLKLDNTLEDRKKLEQLVDQLRAQNDVERYQQLEQFRADREHMEINIQCLKKELTDRHVLISSQNEKISQLDNAIAKHQLLLENGGYGRMEAEKQTAAATRECIDADDGIGSDQQNELDKTRREMDRLLERVRELEREKAHKYHSGGVSETEEGQMPTGTMFVATGLDERTDALKHRIHELEEALQESVGITSEREKALAEQKKLCQKLSDQVAEMFEAGGGALSQHQRQLRDALNALADARNRLEEERLRNQRMVGTVRKELGMALVAEKEAAIALVQSCYGPSGIVPQSVRQRLEQIHRQKERLRHALLTSTTGGGAEKQHEELTRALGTAPPLAPSATAAAVGGVPLTSFADSATLQQQQQFSQPISINGLPNPQPNPPLGLSAPASLTYYSGGGDNANNELQQLSHFYGSVAVDEDGIWA